MPVEVLVERRSQGSENEEVGTLTLPAVPRKDEFVELRELNTGYITLSTRAVLLELLRPKKRNIFTL